MSSERLDPIFGSTVTVDHNPAFPHTFEMFDEGNLIWAHLSDGALVHLPEIRHRMRITMGYGEPNQDSYCQLQQAVEYDVLDDAQRAAVETAIRVDDGQLLRTETLPDFKRLALKHDEAGDKLYTVIHQDGLPRLMHRYPDNRTFRGINATRQLDLPVKHVETVSDGFLVTRFSEQYPGRDTYRDGEVNFFGPEDTFANAFWFMGVSRAVRSDGDPIMNVPREGAEWQAIPRFTIAPVRFMKIAEDRSTLHEEVAAEDAKLFTSLGAIATP